MEITLLDYINSLPQERKGPMNRLVNCFQENLEGVTMQVKSNMIHFVVSLKHYPKGYHCTPGMPLPFISLASQRNFIAVYHMGLYADKSLIEWFVNAYSKNVSSKLDMGKSCVRLKKMNEIPYSLFEELAKKMNANQWITLYEKSFVKK